MANNDLSFEECAKRHWSATPERQQLALRAWLTALCGQVQRSRPEPLQPLMEISKAVGYTPPTLWRLGIHAVNEGFGGRPRYRLSRVLEYLRSPACQKIREMLREERRRRSTSTRRIPDATAGSVLPPAKSVGEATLRNLSKAAEAL
jgi:hypothetical protein